ncbi:dNTP triphosphohydrolase [Haloarcula sp. JP-Z28]|uniref:deoxyguanosinetriphosphate triphosphohydrolase family protein n=1 Tax=Haloarcula sp. JP-Z28 TaxID=2716715 RepID=UPI0014045F5D|nr:dNTP triphosphohydrolase [Haloarcula sp. JP-Z28]NHN65129.1 dNTP triphosphohydrolase [Haloarcula sp. JP-Z28]
MPSPISFDERKERHQKQTPPKNPDYRSYSRQDRDRLRYTREFRRLKNVTQVARSDEAPLYHDRLTHSLKVAQVGDALTRVLMQREGLDPGRCGQPRSDVDHPLYLSMDPFVVQAASHAHDIGHPPFGHAIEELLDDLLIEKTENCGRTIGFEGNAQSFRIITRLANHKSDSGLELTRATLNATLKYPWNRQDNDSKWGYYPDDKQAFKFARKPLPSVLDGEKTLEAKIMDFSDDLTYALHDMSDFYRAGLIPLNRIFLEVTDDNKYQIASREELSQFEDFLSREDSFEFDLAELEISVEEFFRSLTDSKGFDSNLYTRFSGTDKDRIALNKFVSMLVGRYLEDKDLEGEPHVQLEHKGGEIYDLKMSDSADEQIEILKHLTKFYVITNSDLMQQQLGQCRVVRELFEDFYQQANPDIQPKSAIPSPFRERLDRYESRDVPRARFVADLIASLTERQTVALHRRLRGDTPQSLVSNILD